MHVHVSSTRAHGHKVKIVIYSLWFHHTYRWPSGAQVERGLDPVVGCLYYCIKDARSYIQQIDKNGTWRPCGEYADCPICAAVGEVAAESRGRDCLLHSNPVKFD